MPVIGITELGLREDLHHHAGHHPLRVGFGAGGANSWSSGRPRVCSVAARIRREVLDATELGLSELAA